MQIINKQSLFFSTTTTTIHGDPLRYHRHLQPPLPASFDHRQPPLRTPTTTTM
jgi:hypothetical protein